MAFVRNVIVVVLISISSLIVLEFLLFAAFKIREAARGETTHAASDNPNRDQETRQFQHDVQSFQGYPYKAFVGWQSPAISSETLNIDEHLRRRTVNSGPETSPKVHFFGGSTMWGHSVADENTIPSQFSGLTGLHSINLGEQAYNSRQSLNRLLNSLGSIQPGDTVVFFDGVNDVYHNCLSLNSPNGHPREGFIRESLRNGSGGFRGILKSSSIYRLAHGVSQRLDSRDADAEFAQLNRCDDADYADEVASFLVDNWAATEAIVKSRGASFMCVLQPNPYTLPTRPYSHNGTYENQIHQVYPLIRKNAQGLDCFHDYSGSLDQDFYVDHCCHVNAQGNLEIARRFAQDIN